MDYLQISQIQHFAFCKRQWGLIVLEQAWAENEDTVLGQYIHRNVDDEFYREKRKDTIYVRSMGLVSTKLGINGVADLVEYHRCDDGIVLEPYTGYWKPKIVEYKKGKIKTNKCDVYQLAAQMLCLEEMNDLTIQESSLYYKSINKRLDVTLTDQLRAETVELIEEMHRYYKRKETPKAKQSQHCNRCSLKEICVPRLTNRKKSVRNYIRRYVEEK